MEKWMKTVLNGEIEGEREERSLAFNSSCSRDLIHGNLIGPYTLRFMCEGKTFCL